MAGGAAVTRVEALLPPAEWLPLSADTCGVEARDSSAIRDAALTAAAPAQQHPPNEITGFPFLLNIQPMKSLDSPPL